jgi:oligopeptidase B
MECDRKFAVTTGGAAAKEASPPVARRVPHSVTQHGETREDDYHWLREKEAPAVRAYLEAENAYTEAVMRPTEALQERLYAEILGRIQETDLRVPYRKGGYFYYSRTEQGKQYPILCRKKGSLDAPEEITLDLNLLAEGFPFLALGAYEVSDDGNRLAYSLDVTGFREYTLFMKDLRTGELGPERIEKTRSVAWAADNQTLFYVTEDAAKRPYRFYRHSIGQGTDTLLYEEEDERFRLGVRRSRSRAFLFLASDSLTASEVHFLPAAEPTAPLALIVPREAEHEYDVDHHGERFYIRTNSGGRNFRLVSAPVTAPGRQNWREILPHRNDVMIAGLDLFASHAVVYEREDAAPQVRILPLGEAGGSALPVEGHRVTFPEPVYSCSPAENAEFETPLLRLNYQSFSTPPSVFDYDIRTRNWTLLKEEPVLGGYDRTRYRSERRYATAEDGTRVPISLVYREDGGGPGPRPLLLAAYGSYGYPNFPSFSSARLSLLDRGVIYAVAHVRGGGEGGKPWHDAGRMLQKRNTFTDFIACAEHLIATGVTAPDRLIATGGSAGGLLMGAITQMRPDLFRAIVSYVPFVDVINTMSDSSLPLTVGEFEEWGNPAVKEQYDYIRTYCPYSNLARQAYPSLLVKTSLNDSQVMYWEPAKYVARMRALKTDANPLLLKTNMAGGHGGYSGRYDALRELAFDYAFILWQLGIEA